VSSQTVTGQVAFKGKQLKVETIDVGEFTVTISGRLLRMARIRDERWQTRCVSDPEAIISVLQAALPRPDIFTFSQRLPDTQPKYGFYFEYDNVAAIPTTSYEHWLKHQIKPNARNKVRKAEKNGIVTRAVEFDDAFVKGISALYNETPIRQGKRFWHFGKDIETVRRENATYLEKSEFIGAYLNEELVGFLKMVYVGSYAEVMQILALIGQRDKAPTNALVAKAVEICAARGLSHFIYSNYAYGKKGDDNLVEFKRSNGFEKLDIPKYFIPLTLKGRIALALRLHRPLSELLPRRVLLALIDLRAKWNRVRLRSSEGNAAGRSRG
jgi:hypothetical protein